MAAAPKTRKPTRQGRGKLSSMRRVPAHAFDVIEWAEAELAARHRTQEEIRVEMNARLKERGAKTISKSAFNRASIRGALLARDNEQSTAMFAALAPQYTPERVDESNVGMAEFLKTLIFTTGMRLRQGEASPKDALELARGLLALTQVGKVSAERRAKLTAEVVEQAAEVIDAVVANRGLSAEVREELRRDLYGIADEARA